MYFAALWRYKILLIPFRMTSKREMNEHPCFRSTISRPSSMFGVGTYDWKRLERSVSEYTMSEKSNEK